ncbi:DNA polymerase IV [Hornefia butyriciproducens]|uniref:DNA polymerase IV n=1 Tax=Hornefia butyriciproducens TaxID=2652293 RepID=UPI0029FAB067|nr:DNA polymerase IV [Hornefia butyriciproducens]MDD7019662.1 DNA polymerase IV [Hornefia butyriciproducens]MDY5463515.1 DNA polymerase IV [Hornefia butyriciproducens]
MDRIILHCDINSFFASVELLDHPELRDMPVAVSGDPELRHGIILAKNQAAKACGVVTAETVWQARRKCPDLVLLPPQHEKYREFSRRLNRLYQEYTDMVEPFSIDESWLDVTASRALFGSGMQIADRIRHRVREELGITLSAGVSYNKIFAKMGSEYRKPDATTEITRSNYQQLLWPMPVNEMFFVGFATAERLKAADIHTIGDLALADTRMLERLLGKQGPLLRSYARGEDDSPVRRYDQRNKIKSVGNGITFRRNLTGEDDILTALTRLSDTVAGRLRKYQLKAGGVKVDIKDIQLKTISRQTQLTRPTNLADELRRTAMELIRSFWPSQKPIRLITLTAISLCDEAGEEQLSLFREENAAREKTESVERTMDAIRSRFGDSAIGFGQIIGNDIGIDL